MIFKFKYIDKFSWCKYVAINRRFIVTIRNEIVAKVLGRCEIANTTITLLLNEKN